MVELTNVQAPSMAYATGLAPSPTMVEVSGDHTQHGWDDFVDNTRPTEPVFPKDVGPEDDTPTGDVIEAQSKSKSGQTKGRKEKARS